MAARMMKNIVPASSSAAAAARGHVWTADNTRRISPAYERGAATGRR